MLASGSQDTDIILWDVMGETGLFRLRGHTAEVTDLVRPPPLQRPTPCVRGCCLHVWVLPRSMSCLQ